MTSATSSAFSFPFSKIDPDAFSALLPGSDALGVMARETIEASTASTRASVKGMQDAGHTLMAHMKTQMSLSVETGKKLSETDSVEAALAIQAAFMKTAFENNLKGFTRLTRLYTETWRDAVAPLAETAKQAAKNAKSA
jgi:hypothetical protein